jgi:hypothetical protein
LSLDYGALRRNPSSFEDTRERLAQVLGEDWGTPQAHAHRWDRWRRILDVRQPCFGDWLLSLPPAFLSSSRGASRLAAAAVDMDEEMGMERELADMPSAGPGRP